MLQTFAAAANTVTLGPQPRRRIAQLFDAVSVAVETHVVVLPEASNHEAVFRILQPEVGTVGPESNPVTQRDAGGGADRPQLESPLRAVVAGVPLDRFDWHSKNLRLSDPAHSTIVSRP